MNKKILYCVILILTFSFIAGFANETGKKVAEIVDFDLIIDNQEKNMQNDMVIIDGSTYVPLREISNLFGFNVRWNEENKKIDILTKIQSATDSNYKIYMDKETYLQGYTDKEGNKLTDAIYPSINYFNDGVAWVRHPDSKGEAYNSNILINSKFEQISEQRYDNVSHFKDGVACVNIAFDESPGTFFIDKAGNELFGGKRFINAFNFCEGYAIVATRSVGFRPTHDNSNRYSYIDMSGELATELEFMRVTNFIDGYAKVITDNGRKGEIDKEFNFYPNEDDSSQ